MKFKATKLVRRWVKPHKVKGYYRNIKVITYINFRKSKKEKTQ